MTRRNLRDNIFRAIFRIEFNQPDEMEEQTELLIASIDGAAEEDKEYIRTKVKKIIEQIDHIDIMISEASEGWSLRRIGKAELAVLRLAVYEIKYDSDIPYKVAINEAVELAKRYTTPEAASFINGILARIEE